MHQLIEKYYGISACIVLSETRSSAVLEKYCRERWKERELSDLERTDEIVRYSNEQYYVEIL